MKTEPCRISVDSENRLFQGKANVIEMTCACAKDGCGVFLDACFLCGRGKNGNVDANLLIRSKDENASSKMHHGKRIVSKMH